MSNINSFQNYTSINNQLKDKNLDIKEESSDSGSSFKTFGYIILFIVALAIIFFIYHAIRKRNVASGSSLENKDMVF